MAGDINAVSEIRNSLAAITVLSAVALTLRRDIIRADRLHPLTSCLKRNTIMTDKLTSLRQYTTVVADTGDIAAMKLYQPQDATTNPSLILNAAQIPEYRKLIDDAVAWAKQQSNDRAQQIVDATDKLAVNIGLEILKLVPGRISTEVDARLSYDTEASIAKAKRLIKLYNDAGISNDRILIKLASTAGYPCCGTAGKRRHQL